MNLRSIIAALIVVAASNPASAAKENYKFLDQRPPSGEVKTDFYSFSYELPEPAYKSISWRAYSDLREPRNSVMVTGMNGYDTYALSVLYQGTALAGQDALSLAREKYPKWAFSAGPNSACANTWLDRPFLLSDRMVAMMAVCVDKDSLAIYQLMISWQSLILAVQSIDQIVHKSRICAEVKAVDPEMRCPDQIGNYARAFGTFLSSFASSGK